MPNALLCLAFALIYQPPQVSSKVERLYWMLPTLLFIIVATLGHKTAHFIARLGGFLQIDYFDDYRWQGLQYRDALLGSHWVGGSDHNLLFIVDLAGSGWPVAIAVTYGLVYAIAAAFLLLTLSGILLWISLRLRSISPELLSLVSVFGLALLINLGVTSTIFPTTSIVPPSFGGASGYVAGGAYMALLFLYFRRAMRGIGSGTLVVPLVGPGLLSAKDKVLVYLGFVEYGTRETAKGEPSSNTLTNAVDDVQT